MDHARRRKAVLIFVAIALAAWAAVALWVVPMLIRSAYAGESFEFLNRRITGQAQTPVEGYLAIWRRAALLITAGLVVAGAAGLALIRIVPRVPGALRRTAAGLPAAGLRGVLLLALWTGLLAGLAEAVNGLIRHRIQHLPTGEVVSGELIWMAPLAAVCALALSGVLLFLLDRAVRANGALLGLAAPLFATVSVYSLFRALALGFANYAVLLLALGAGTLLARALAAKPEPMRRVVRVSSIALVGLLIVWAVAVPVWRRVRATRALAGLPDAPAGAPNIIVLIWDTARALDISLYGWERETTPNLDRLAAESVVFDRAYATAPWSLPSHGSIFTGRYPPDMTVGHRSPLDATHPTLAERLAEYGWATAGFTANLFYGSASYGIARGFSYYDDRPPLSFSVVGHTWWASRMALQWTRLRLGNHQSMLRRRADHVNRAVLRWIDRQGDRPFLAVVNHFDAHQPYIPPPPYNTAFWDGQPRGWFEEAEHTFTPAQLNELRAAYDGSLLYLDAELGRFVAALRERGLLDNTVLIITSDHGDEFGEHGADLVGHSKSLYASVLHVPLVIRSPAKLPQGVRRTELVSIRDIPATVMDLAGLGEASPFPGTSLARYADGRATPEDIAQPRLATTEKHRWAATWPHWPASAGELFAVFDGDWQYILDGHGQEHLWDLAADPLQKNDLALATNMASQLERMRMLLDSLAPPVAGSRNATRRVTHR